VGRHVFSTPGKALLKSDFRLDWQPPAFLTAGELGQAALENDQELGGGEGRDGLWQGQEQAGAQDQEKLVN